MLSGSEKYYDDIYSAMGKDYALKQTKSHKFIQKYKRTDGNSLLDVACGTGTHAGFLSKYYKVRERTLTPTCSRSPGKSIPKSVSSKVTCGTFDLGTPIRCCHLPVQCHRLHEDENRPSKGSKEHEPPSPARRSPARGTLVFTRNNGMWAESRSIRWTNLI